MEISQNSWESGLNKDLSKTALQSNKYISASNFRISTDKGGSETSLENIKGNIFNKSIPNIGAVQKISIVSNDPTQTIKINGSAVTAFDTTNKSPIDLYNLITTFTECGVNYNAYYNYSFVLIVPILTNPLIITLGGAGGLVLNSTYIAAQSDLQVIGNTSINDDIYIFTTNSTAIAPTSDIGQIWKLVIDDVTNGSTLTLIYNNVVNFSTYNAIAPTAIQGRYENGSIQRIYWTDFYNRIRQINVADPQAFALDVNLLELVPAVNFDIPILSEIHNGGTLKIKVGVYQMAYRFKNTTGSVTNFSPLSNIVSVVNHDESISILSNSYNEFRGYTGDAYGTSTNKTISWTVNNVDTEFDRIEFVVLIREKKDDVPTIYSFNEENISGRTSISTTLNGDILASTNTTVLTLPEFMVLSGYFTHAKTLATKDNRLIAGNIRSASADINFDARAFRAFTSAGNDIYLTNGSVANALFTLANAELLPENSDAINDYINKPCLYKPGTAILGGAGTNISYEFVSVAVMSDAGNGSSLSTSFDLPIHQTADIGFRSTIHSSLSGNTLLDLNVFSSDKNGADVLQQYSLALPQINYVDMKFSQHNSNYWGYQQNEIYRIAIQFYDKALNKYFAKWIGDIKFPDINDVCPAANNLFTDGTQTGQTSFVKSFVLSGKAYITQLGLKINVSIPANITDIISGYSIVRVKREESDKTVIAEGIITSVGNNATASNYFTPDPNGGAFMGSAAYTLAEPRVCFFNTPNHLISGITEPRASDKLTIRKTFQSVSGLNTTDLASGSADLYSIYRLYTEVATAYQAPITIGKVINLGIGQNVIGGAINGYSVNNNDNNHVSLGNQCYFLDLNGTAISAYGSASDKLYATIDRVLAKQYGGNTYGERASNEYILCSHFRPVKTSSTSYSDFPLIFGGDTMNYHIDMQRAIKDWLGGGTTKLSTTFIFPTGSCANVGFRYGTFVNYNLITNGGLASDKETYDYNRVYSAENDIIKFFPKPDPYIINNEFTNRFVASEIKVNGELSDSWSVFKPLNYWDVESTYGPINACDVLNDQVYFAQDRAFGHLIVNPRTAISGTDGEIIQLGKGDIMDRHEYISTEIGSKHQFSFIKSAYNIFFLDIRHKKIYAFNPSTNLSPESDLKGMHGWCQTHLINSLENTDKPVYSSAGHNGIHGVYDYTNNELIYTIFEYLNTKDAIYNKYTIVYNDLLKTYVSDNYSHYPKQYITNHRKFLSPNPSTSITYKDLYLHNYGNYGEFYGLLFDSSVEFISNKYPEVTKEFTNLMWSTEIQDGTTLIDIDSGLTPSHESFTKLEASTDYQSNTVIFDLLTNLKRRFRTFTAQVPKHSVNAPYVSTGFFSRMRDKYLKLKFSYTNNNNRRMIVHKINTIFSINIPR